MANSEALQQLLQYIDINQADDGSLGDPFVILISYQQQADKLRFIEELTQSSLTTDLKFKTYFPNIDKDHGTGKIIGHLVDDAKHDRLSLITSLATKSQGELDHQFLSYINLNRDRLTYQNLHYVLFVKADQMEDFVAGAPDLWSFRQQVLYLERDDTQNIPNLELSSQLMWQNIETDIEQSAQDPAIKQQAAEKIAETKALVANISNNQDKAQLLFDLAEWLMRRELYIQAFEVAELTLINHSDIKPEFLTNLYYICGTTQYRIGHYHEAIKHFQQGLTLKRDILEADFHYMLGDCHFCLTLYDTAILHYNDALELAKLHNNKSMQVLALGRKADIKRVHDELDESIETYQQAISIAKKFKLQDKEAWLKQNLGMTYYRQRQYDLALEHYQASLIYNEQSGYLEGIANCHISISQALLAQGNLDDVKDHLTEGVTTAEKINNKAAMALAYGLLAEYHQTIDKLLAISYAQKSHNLYTQLNDSDSVYVAELLTKLTDD